jgi:hypothetical protein
MDRRKTGLALAAAGVLALSAMHTPTADIRIEMHRVADLNPARFQAAVDIGVVAVRFLVTWSAHGV